MCPPLRLQQLLQASKQQQHPVNGATQLYLTTSRAALSPLCVLYATVVQVICLWLPTLALWHSAHHPPWLLR